MNKEIIEAAINSTRMSDEHKKAVRLVLIEGKGQTEAGEALGIKKQVVHKSVKRIESAIKSSLGVPDDWEVLTVTLPKEDAREMIALEEKRKKEFGLKIKKN